MATKKPKPAVPIALMPLHDEVLKVGFSPEYWKRHFVYYSKTANKTFEEYSYNALNPLQCKGYVRKCGFCATMEADGKLPCSCMIHSVCGRPPKVYTSLEACYGKCKDPKHCTYCCTCVVCGACKKLHQIGKSTSPWARRFNKVLCPTCQHCKECCKCTVCNVCDKKISRDACACATRANRHHARCCQTDARFITHGPEVLFIERAPHFMVGTDFQQVRSRRLLSVETEILDAPKPSGFVEFNKKMRALHCGVVKEGTVPQGFEINSNPASGDQFYKVINGITNALKCIDARINIRCGTHCHVDARDFRYADLVNLAHLYYKIEPALFAMLPPWRRLSRFAVPCREQLLKIATNGEKMVHTLRDPELASYYPVVGKQMKMKPSIAVRIAEGLYNAKTLREQKLIHKNSTNQHLRYMALNLHSWVYRRTVEFRHWPGSTDEQELILWPQICAAILDGAKRLPVHSTKHTPLSIDKLSAHPVEALLQILRPSSKVSSLLRPFVEAKLRQWSPDFDVWWPITQIGGNECVVPFKDPSHDELVLSFDLANNFFTYIKPRHRAQWDLEWLRPTEAGGRYAEIGDMHAIPSRGKVLWMKEQVEPKPAVKAAVLTTNAQVLGYDLVYTHWDTTAQLPRYIRHEVPDPLPTPRRQLAMDPPEVMEEDFIDDTLEDEQLHF